MAVTIAKKENLIASMHKADSAAVEELAFAHWQYNANEKVYAANLITRNMYEFARNELRKTIDHLSKLCYSDNRAGDDYGFIKGKAAIR